MSILDNLKGIVTFDFSNLTSVDININLFSGNKSSKQIEYKDNILGINLDKIKPSDLPKLKKYVADSVQLDDVIVIEEEANKRLTDISEVEKYSDTNNLLDFFKGKISNADLEILRASLYIKVVYERGERVGDLKENIIQKHGERGKNIVNLCTAGYFSSIIKPLYIEMVSNPNFTPSMFLEAFNTIVNNTPFAIFVSSPMTLEELIREMEEKMTINKKYGIHYLNLHGIGENNVSKIENAVSQLKEKFTHNPDVESSGKKYLNVTIYF